MQFLQKHFYIILLIGIFLFSACAPESKYNGGKGALRSYESMDAYDNSTIKYRQDYTQPTQSSFSSTLVANDRDNIKQTPQNNRTTRDSSVGKKPVKSTTPTGTSPTSTFHEPPVKGALKGSDSFTPTKSLLGGMRDSEAIQRATMRPYTVRGKTYRPHPVKVGDTFDGIASWYGPDFHAKATSNGETYNMHAHTAAHKTFPMNTIVKVYNKDNGKTTVVRINDRGPFVEGRIIDLSNVAAHDIAMVNKGIANVRVEVIGFGGDLANTSQKDSKPQVAPQKKNKPDPKPQQEQQNVISNPKHDMQTALSESMPQQTIPRSSMQTTDGVSLQSIQTIEPVNAQANNMQIEDNPAEEQSKKEQNQMETSDTISNDATSHAKNHNSFETNVMSTQDSATSEKVPQDTTTKSLNRDNEKVNSMPVMTSSGEELPNFDGKTQDKKQEMKHEMEGKQEQKQQTESSQDEALETTSLSTTPKHIDNTESIKDIEAAIQRLKDSTQNLAKKAQTDMQEHIEVIAQHKKQEIMNPQINTPVDTKVEDTISKDAHHSNMNSKKADSINVKNSNFMVSLNVFSDEERAKNFRDEKQNIAVGTSYSIDIVSTDKGYRVALRGFTTYDEAKAFITTHNIQGYVIEEGK